MGSIQQHESAKLFPDGIDVVVVGTGLAGLTAALECHRKQMNVRILEKNATINTAGDMFFMGLSSTLLFKHWPEMKEEYDSISLRDAWIETRKHSGEVMVKPMKVSDRLRAAGLDVNTPPGTFQMRPLIYKMFVRQVERSGLQVEFGKNVVDYYEDEQASRAGVILADGTRIEADLIIAADGVGSKSQKLVGGQVRADESGRAMWRAAFPIENLDKDQDVKEAFSMIGGTEPIVRTWLGPNTYALTLTRPEVVVWVMNHDADIDNGSQKESWNDTIDAAEVLDGMDKVPGPVKWSSMFKRLVKCTPPNTILNFSLLWRNPQPSWTSPKNRVIQIGDAAHSFLPASGNGATQAIEDGVSLATCLQKGGKQDIALAVQAHIRLRFIRTACCQKIGFANADLFQETDWAKVKLDPRKAAPKLPKWIWSHDAEQYAEDNYEKAVDSIRKGIPAEEETSYPPNYPSGYKYKPWTIEDIMDDKRNNRETYLGEGEWE